MLLCLCVLAGLQEAGIKYEDILFKIGSHPKINRKWLMCSHSNQRYSVCRVKEGTRQVLCRKDGRVRYWKNMKEAQNYAAKLNNQEVVEIEVSPAFTWR